MSEENKIKAEEQDLENQTSETEEQVSEEVKEKEETEELDRCSGLCRGSLEGVADYFEPRLKIPLVDHIKRRPVLPDELRRDHASNLELSSVVSPCSLRPDAGIENF